ncbi:MAG: hypothetical protein KGJ69_15515, partial [Thermoplasmata archaeon]|nr:hypothetical protein [Thermoplasmata archaeon]
MVLEKGTHLAPDVYMRQLGALLVQADISAKDLLRIARKKDPSEFRRLLRGFAREMKESPSPRSGKPRLVSYIIKTFSGVQSFLRHHGVKHDPDNYPHLSVKAPESLVDEEVPRPSELRQVLSLLSARGRVIALVMAQSGIRPGALGSYDGTDGVVLKDLPDLDLTSLTFAQVPFRVRVRGARSKTGLEYFTFGGQEGADMVLGYLQERRAEGEELTPDSPLISVAARGVKSHFRVKAGNMFLTTVAVTREIREAMDKVVPKGTTWRPYVLRAYFSTRLQLAGSERLMTRDTREYLMGHLSGSEAAYGRGKHRQPKEVLENYRKEYERAYRHLSTITSTPDDTARALLSVILADKGISPEEQKELGVTSMSAEELLALVSKHDAGRGPRLESSSRSATTPRPQDVVSAAEVKDRVRAGWEV